MAINSSIRHPLCENVTFQHGLEHGFSWFLYGDTPTIPPMQDRSLTLSKTTC
jgi:hypothetical protein